VIGETAQKTFPSGQKKRSFDCLCECGKEVNVTLNSLQSGCTQSCGCLHKDRTSESRKTHGASKTKLYGVWSSMKARCFSISCSDYPTYGGRGVTVCSEWVTSFICFREWAIGEGYGEGLTIDRKDNNGDYNPDNCRWITNSKNATEMNLYHIKHKTGAHSEGARDKLKKKVRIFREDLSFSKDFDSITEAGEYLSTILSRKSENCRKQICLVISDKSYTKTVSGYSAELIKDEDLEQERLK